MIWIKIVNICGHSVRKQSPAWKFSFCLLQRHFGDSCVCHILRLYRRIARIFLSIRATPNALRANQNLCLRIQKYRLRSSRISSTNPNYVVLMPLTSTFLHDISWMSSPWPVGVGASGVHAPSELDGDSSFSHLALCDLVRLTAKSPWWDFERAGR